MTGDPEPTPDGVAEPAQPPDSIWHAPRLWPRVLGVGVLLLVTGGVFLWQSPGLLRGLLPRTNGDGAALEARVARLEQRPALPDPAALTARLDALEQKSAQTADLGALTARLDALEARLAAGEGTNGPAPNLGPVLSRLTALEARPAPAAPDLHPLTARLDALERKAADQAAQTASTAANASRLDDVQRQIAGLHARDAASASQAGTTARLARLGTAAIALAAGQPLGAIPDAPPALARFATAAPPTEASLRLAFPAAMRAAVAVSLPDVADKSFLERVLARLQDVRLITVREGDRVIVGNQTADLLGRAQSLLDKGDLEGAVRIVASVSGPPAEKMAPWLADAQALLAAREALVALTRQG